MRRFFFILIEINDLDITRSLPILLACTLISIYYYNSVYNHPLLAEEFENHELKVLAYNWNKIKTRWKFKRKYAV